MIMRSYYDVLTGGAGRYRYNNYLKFVSYADNETILIKLEWEIF
jgi:hypothetical protein